ncbi:MAG TPA: flagellar hook capping FlgD N-terminal domain-containing protein [Mycobacteriales bacterium]
MTTPITTPVTTPLSQVVGATTATPSTPSNDLADKDTFLKLLVAQLKYQDPSNPADSTAFMAQTAQFTQVERLNDIKAVNSDQLVAQMMLSASGMVGKAITWAGPDGKDVTGIVTSAHFNGSAPTLRVGDKDVPLPAVKEVKAAAAG